MRRDKMRIARGTSTPTPVDHALLAAARRLSAFDPLGALDYVALRNDAAALMLRGVALAQLGQYPKARQLLRRAEGRLDAGNASMRARCLAALGEVALAERDLSAAGRALEAAAAALDALGDRLNALFVRLQLARRLVLLGDVAAADAAIRLLDVRGAPPHLRGLMALVQVDIDVRSLRPERARASLALGRSAAADANVAALTDEIERAVRDLEAPVARIVGAETHRFVTLDEVASLRLRAPLIVDACRREVRARDVVVTLVTRPMLLRLAVILGRAAAVGATRDELVVEAFDARRVSESLRVRLRVEIGRLRRELRDVATVSATKGGYALVPRRGTEVVVLVPPVAGEESAILALLRAGESWTTSALATAMGSAQRTVQRALAALLAEGRVEATGRGRSQRWVARPPAGYATNLLLVARPRSG